MAIHDRRTLGRARFAWQKCSDVSSPANFAQNVVFERIPAWMLPDDAKALCSGAMLRYQYTFG